MPVNHVHITYRYIHIWYLLWPEESFRSPETGAPDKCELQHGLWVENAEFWKSISARNL